MDLSVQDTNVLVVYITFGCIAIVLMLCIYSFLTHKRHKKLAYNDIDCREEERSPLMQQETTTSRHRQRHEKKKDRKYTESDDNESTSSFATSEMP